MKTPKEFIFLLPILFSISVLAQTSFNISNKTFGDTLFTIDNNGNVGIGTTSPAANLEVLSTDPDQNSTFRLGTSDLSHYLHLYSGRSSFPNPLIFWSPGDALRFGTSFADEYMRLTSEGNLGIGTTTPSEMLEVADTIYSTVGGFKFPDGTVQSTSAMGGENGFLSTGTFGIGTIPAEGAGTRMMWYPAKAAFRVGQVLGTNWDDTQVGENSTSMGYNNIASGLNSVALGGNNTASATIATALGGSNTASGLASTAMGNATEASGAYSTAMGASTVAYGNYSMAMGQEIEARGSHTFAIALSDQNGLQVLQDTTMAIMGGRIGIGTIAPTTRLEVADTIYSSVGGFKFPDGTVQETASDGGASSLNDLSDAISNVGCVFLGRGAGENNTSSANENTGIGVGALNVNTDGMQNTAVGAGALINNTVGSHNTATGYGALVFNTTGAQNTAVGTSALISNTIGNYNVAIGSQSDIFNQQGSQNTIIGFGAGHGSSIHDKSGNVFLGYRAGYYETEDDKLYIENSNSSSPLIGGDFATDEIYLNGKVGIDTTASAAELHVGGIDGVLFSGTVGSGSIAAEGPGVRMVWYPAKAAFRAGIIEDGGFYDDFWDADSIGEASFAAGKNTKASGDGSVALGNNSLATRSNAIALGYLNRAYGSRSTAIGSSHWVTGDLSSAMGYNVTVSGSGSYAIGDYSTGSYDFSASNRFYARFSNGYYLYSSSNLSTGVRVLAGGNSWSSISDSTKKENFQSTDGENFLNKISRFKLTSWNYKGQDPNQFRHYGPMAQDFYAAFGNDGIGTIGNDTTIASADFDGINFIAIQALEKRTTENKEIYEELQNRIKNLEEENLQLKKQLVGLASIVREVKTALTNYQNQNSTNELKITSINNTNNLLQNEN